jgi:hypothetical protein
VSGDDGVASLVVYLDRPIDNRRSTYRSEEIAVEGFSSKEEYGAKVSLERCCRRRIDGGCSRPIESS